MMRAAIQRSLQGVCPVEPLVALHDSIAQCNRWRRRLEMASVRNWQAAAKDAAEKLRGALDTLKAQSTRAVDDLQRRSMHRLEPTATSIYRDIEGLRGEFECVTIDRAKQQLSVQTSRIELEDVYLGCFEIR